MSEEKRSGNNLFPVVIIMMAALYVMAVSNRHHAGGGYTASASYRTGVPDSEEIHHGTVKTFHEDQVLAEEDWKWSKADQDTGRYDNGSTCGHIRKWKMGDGFMDTESYTAIVWENYSREWDFATLQEAEAFVERWCKP